MRQDIPEYRKRASSRSTFSGESPASRRRDFTVRRLPVSSYRSAYSIARRSLSGALILHPQQPTELTIYPRQVKTTCNAVTLLQGICRGECVNRWEGGIACCEIPRAGEFLHELPVVQHVVIRAGQLLLELADVQQVVDVNKASQFAQYSDVLGHVEGLRSERRIPGSCTKPSKFRSFRAHTVSSWSKAGQDV